jgi:hypothetical protein
MNRRGRGHPIAIIAAVSAVALAACGSLRGVSSSAGTGGRNTEAIKFAACMRSHGVPSFPDPGAPGGFSGVTKRSPAFRSAMQTCLRLLPPGRSTGAQLTEQQRNAALAQAQCIRSHGVPNFPDPTFPSSGGELIPAAPGFDPASPAFKRAAAACGLTATVGLPHRG